VDSFWSKLLGEKIVFNTQMRERTMKKKIQSTWFRPPRWMIQVLGSSFGVVLLDQLSKIVASRMGWVTINPGISFSWFAAVFTQVPLLVLLPFFCILIFWICTNYAARYPVWVGVFIGGALSNFIDRIFFGGVLDWFWLPGIGVYNNLADWAICLSVLGILLGEIRQQSGGERKS
jgi:hypothetical protein